MTHVLCLRAIFWAYRHFNKFKFPFLFYLSGNLYLVIKRQINAPLILILRMTEQSIRNRTRSIKHVIHNLKSPVPCVPSDEQKSIGLKFSKSRTGSHVTYSCHHNSSRFTCPIKFPRHEASQLPAFSEGWIDQTLPTLLSVGAVQTVKCVLAVAFGKKLLVRVPLPAYFFM